MSRNGVGTYTLPAPPAPFQNGQTISATDMMTVLNDVATALTASTANDGQTTITGNWNFQSKNLSNVGTLTATAAVIVDQSITNGLTVGNGLVVTKGTTTVPNGTAGTQAVNYSQFATTAASPGSFTLPTGLIVKWGTGGTTLGIGNVTYAAAFPSATHNVQMTIAGGSGAVTLNPVLTATVNAAGFDVRGDATQSLSFYWLAIGS